MAKILIATPTLDGQIGAEQTSFALHLSRWREETHGFAFGNLFLGGVSPRDYARNHILADFLFNPDFAHFEWLWWIDADMKPSEETLNLLHAMKQSPGYDIYTGFTFAYRRTDPLDPNPSALPLLIPAFTAWGPEQKTLVATNDRLPKELIACGFGCTLISRACLADERNWAEPGVKDEGGVPAVMRDLFYPSGKYRQSEDINFTFKAHSNGYKILYVGSAGIGHYKRMNIAEGAEWAEASFHEGFTAGGNAVRDAISREGL